MQSRLNVLARVMCGLLTHINTELQLIRKPVVLNGTLVVKIVTLFIFSTAHHHQKLIHI